MRLYSKMGSGTDLQAMLKRAGIGPFLAPMSVVYMNMLPSTTDPYSAGASQLVRGLQRLLNEHGARLVVDGGMGEKTVRALQEFAGPRWFDKSWAQLYNDVLAGKRWAGYQRTSRETMDAAPPQPDGLGTSFVGDLIDSPLGLLGIAAAGVFLWRRSRFARSRS